MAAIDEVKERIGWLKVLFGFAAAAVAALMSWLLIQLQETLQNLRLEDVLNLERLNWWHGGAFVFLMASYLAVFALKLKVGKFVKLVLIGIVIAIDFALLLWLIKELGEGIATPLLRATLNLWHAGAMLVIAFFLVFMLVAIWEIDKLITKSRSL